MQEGVRGVGPNFEYLSAIKVSVKDKSTPKAFNDIPGGTSKSIWIRIIFTKISNNKVLVVNMTATINR